MRLLLAFVLGSALLFASAANAGLIVDKRLGNNTEGTTVITSGPYASSIAVLDGYDVLAIPVEGRGRTTPQTLFDVKSIPWGSFPSGIAYVPTERGFVFDDQGDFGTLQSVSSAGVPQAPRPITFLPQYPLDALFSVEGITYLPDTAPWPDAFARAAWFANDANAAHIEIISRTGTVLAEIPVPLPPDDAYITGISYTESGFVIGTPFNSVWRVGFDGAITAGPFTVDGVSALEGLSVLPGGRAYVADYAAGNLFALDRSLQRDAAGDRPYPVGLGVTRSFDGFWDSVSGNWAFLGLDRQLQDTVALVGPGLDSSSVLFHPPVPVFGVSAGPGGRVASCSAASPGIVEFSRSGAILSTLRFASVAGMPLNVCRFLTYLPSIDSYVVRVRNAANRRTLFVISRSGTLRNMISGVVSTALTTPPDRQDRFVSWNPFAGVATTYDAATGSVLASASVGFGPLVIPFGYAAGPGGMFALIDPNDSEVGVFGP